jgi:hypothetical protein
MPPHALMAPFGLPTARLPSLRDGTDAPILESMATRIVEIGGAVDENEMIAEFGLAEVDSSRYQGRWVSGLEAHHRTRSVFDAPHHDDASEIADRRALLRGNRGYPNMGLFEGFPSQVRWYRGSIQRCAMGNLRYGNHPDWRVLSGGSRLVRDGAANIDLIQISDNANATIKTIVGRILRGDKLAEPIVVGVEQDGPLTVLEGHFRATAYTLASLTAPEPAVQVVVGLSPNIGAWRYF